MKSTAIFVLVRHLWRRWRAARRPTFGTRCGNQFIDPLFTRCFFFVFLIFVSLSWKLRRLSTACTTWSGAARQMTHRDSITRDASTATCRQSTTSGTVRGSRSGKFWSFPWSFPKKFAALSRCAGPPRRTPTRRWSTETWQWYSVVMQVNFFFDFDFFWLLNCKIKIEKKTEF